MAKRGHKSQRGIPEIYDEPKKSRCLALTQTAVQKLDNWASSLQLSRSELVEKLARQEINGTSPPN